jgi:PAS domain S-box-containing protein
MNTDPQPSPVFTAQTPPLDSRLALGPDVQSSLDLLEKVLSASGAGFAYVDRDFHFVRANHWLASANGRELRDMIGCRIVDVVGNEYWDKIRPFIESSLAGTTTVDAPITRESRRNPGSIRTALLSYFPAEVDAEIVGVVVVVKDITDQLRAEQALRQSEIQSRLIAESARAQARFERTQRFMAELSEQMHTATGSDEVLWRVVNLLGKHMKVDRCAYGEIDHATGQITIYRDYCHRLPSLAGTYKRLGFGQEVRDELLAGNTVVFTNTQTDPRSSAQFEAVYAPLRILASINVPIMKQGRQVATFAVQQSTPREWTDDEISLVETVGDGTWLSVENARLTRVNQQVEARQRVFVRDILASVTEGRLHLCQTPEDLPQPLARCGDEMPLTHDDDIAPLRHAVQDLAHQLEFPAFRTVDLVTATGEAAMNAVVHADRGKAWICTDNKDIVQVWIEDHGSGIAVEDLPNATLTRGYSTTHTLGHGFKIMLHTADRVYLLTGATGTTVVLEQDRSEPEPNW